MYHKIFNAFKDKYHSEPDFIVRSPGRVNLIGEHTDYNEGFVFPLAIKYAQWLALKATGKQEVRIYTADLDEADVFSLTDFSEKGQSWIKYPQGIAYMLKEDAWPLTGWDGLLMGDLPLGAGLSSSAALDMVTARAFSLTGGFAWDVRQMARVAQRTENQWVGINSGIMDQLISGAGEAGKALLIDCRTLNYTSYSLPEGTVIVVMDSMVKHSLVASAYNERREQCMEGAQAFGKRVLRDVSLEEFENGKAALSDVVQRRCRHVLSENLRTLAAAKAMEANDPVHLGELMNASHASLRDDFEVSCTELDILAEQAQREYSCYGARMTGGGFGGSAIALVQAEEAGAFIQNMLARYEKETGIRSNMFVTDATRGTSVEYP